MDRKREFESLLTPVAPVAYRVAYNLTRNAEDAMDLVQDATAQAFKAFETFQVGSNFRAWFLRILTNRFLKVRAKHSLQTVPLEDVEDVFLFKRTKEAALHGNHDDPVSLVLGGLDTDEIRQALDQLPPDFRATAVMYFLNDFTYEQIAEILEVPVGTVRSRLHRGRKLLQKALWEMAEERGLVGGSQRG